MLALFTAMLLPAAAAARSRPSAARRPLTVGYFPQWGIYDEPQYFVKNLVTSGAVRLLDQINYAQGFVTGGRCSVADPNADLNFIYPAANSVNGRADRAGAAFRGNFHQLRELKRKYPKLKILISLEGKASSFAEDAQPQNRAAFVTSCVDVFLRGRFAPGVTEPGIFDGIDLDWEYPHEEDAANFVALLTEFRRQMNALRPGLRLTIAVGFTPHMYPGTDFSKVNALVDEVGLMTYDYTGPWNRSTGFLAPLYASVSTPGLGNSIDRSVTDFTAAGVSPAKLLIGLPFYGYGWQEVAATNGGLFQPGESIRGDRPYRYIQSLIGQSTVQREPRSGAPWLYRDGTFWTFEDPVSVGMKAQYAVDHHLGGVMVWELSGDLDDAALLKAAHARLAALDGSQAKRRRLFARVAGAAPEASQAEARGQTQ